MLFVSDGCDRRNFHSKELARISGTEVVSLAIRAYDLSLAYVILSEVRKVDMD